MSAPDSPETRLLVPDLIRRKRDGGNLSPDEVAAFVDAMARGSVGEEQIGAFLMAVYFKGMVKEEVIAMTEAMRDSGDVMSWPECGPVVGDKHSTGGVGDKVSLPLAPALAACGAYVPMVSGRGLGHTGGTLDKMESIPGYQTRLSEERIKAIVQDVGCIICGQTERIAPADGLLYSIRDVTATVSSVPLITASILSKKAAAGLHALVLDVKVGRGAFMNSLAKARELANSLVATGNGLGINTTALITEMDHPIGRMVGNALEVAESVDCLKGRGPADLEELVTALGGALLSSVGLASDAERGAERIRFVLHDGSALDRFARMVAAAGGDPRVVDQGTDLLAKAPITTDVHATRAGYLACADSLEIARVALELGAGRVRKEDPVDPATGIELLVERGAQVAEGTPLLRVHHRDTLSPAHQRRLSEAVEMADDPLEVAPRVVEVLR